MTNKELYRDFCKNNSQLPLFMTDWWMDAVCAGKQWDVLLSFNEQGAIQAAMPYLLRKRLWMKYIIMPQQTQIGGIWIAPSVAGNDHQVATICQDFSQQLADLGLSYYAQHYPINSPAIETMRALGFKAKERVTYRIEDLSDLDQVISNFSKNKKRQLQRALSLHAESNMSVEDFYRYHVQCLHEQGKQISYSREFLLVLERKAARMQQCQILSLDRGQRGWLLVDVGDKEFGPHRISISHIVSILKNQESKEMLVETENSFYKLRRENTI